ncbi:helix-turn-helix domain-containing protein [Streptomyces sp. NRRL B-1381]|uniref:helix-turn-helix domain-containing protein n=1 Tax=Streptomyces sp. NRRL B-1381 TaxID=1463829 RepID=UPI0004C252C0|nr:helix-turn-helix transcriptional regulator [Streptomyces sp. NRRL B-1381]
MSTACGPTRIGARIREQRRLAHLTQRQLAQRLPYSYSLLNQVECGAREASSSFVSAVAGALGIDITLLTDSEAVTSAQRDRLAAMVSPIRDALDRYDLPAGDVPGGAPLPQLVAEADAACRQVRATRLRAASRVLPTLITGLTREVQLRPRTDAWRALASVYRTAHDITVKVGYTDLAGVALDRMGWAAERASDPCLAAVRHYKRALVRQERRDLGTCLIEAGRSLLDGDTSKEALVVAGQLHLGAVVVAARAGDRAAVADHLGEAHSLADRVGGEAAEVHWLSFGHTNIALHALGARIRMRQWDEALVEARAIRLGSGTLTSRRARYLVDRAQVEMETGHTTAALQYLMEARRVAPEQTRHLPGTRVTVSGLVHTMRRPPEELAHLATWVGR